jgi:RNA polymerase sigma-70 factor, ECF subfamily
VDRTDDALHGDGSAEKGGKSEHEAHSAGASGARPNSENTYQMLPVADLVRLLTLRDRRAWEEAVRRFQVPVYTVLYRLSCDQLVAEDLAQEVFIQARDSIDGLRNANSIEPWLCRIATTKFCSYCRARRSEREAYKGLKESASTEFEGDSRWWAEEEDKRERAQKAIFTLPLELREVMTLRWKGVSVSQCAKTLGIPIGTVKSRTHTAMEIIRRDLGLADEHRKA